MPPIMRFLIVCAFFYHYNSVSAFLDHEDVGVLVLSHLSHTWIQFQTLVRFRAAWDHVRVNRACRKTPSRVMGCLLASLFPLDGSCSCGSACPNVLSPHLSARIISRMNF